MLETDLALGLVSFLVAFGFTIDYFRRTALTAVWDRLGEIGWSDIPYQAVSITDKLLSVVFGEKVVSLLCFRRAAILSLILNVFILGVFFSVEEIGDAIRGHYPFELLYWVKELFVHIVAPSIPGMIHDIFSLLVTRVLIREYIRRRNVISLVFDIIIAIVLFRSTRAMLATGFDIGFDRLLDTLSSLPMLQFALQTWMDAFKGQIGMGEPRFTICSLSTLLPTWIYLISAVGGALVVTFSRKTHIALEYLSRGGEKRYTVLFTVGSVLLVLVAATANIILAS